MVGFDKIYSDFHVNILEIIYLKCILYVLFADSGHNYQNFVNAFQMGQREADGVVRNVQKMYHRIIFHVPSLKNSEVDYIIGYGKSKH